MMTGLVLAQQDALGEYDEDEGDSGAVAGSGEAAAWAVWAWVLAGVAGLLGLGAIEDWYGLTDSGDVFGSDAVQYLDVARAMGRGDWHAALNPLWSQGYPALLAVARPYFAVGMAGDWNMIRMVNLLIFCLGLGCFYALIRSLGGVRRDPLFLLGAGAVFVTAEICLGQVSRVGPDELVSAFFFLACALVLRLARGGARRPVWVAAELGLVLGLGFLAKAVFLPLGCGMLVVLAVARLRGGLGLGKMVPAVVLFGAIVLGYGAALSGAVGHRTLGESGALNYAWHVNRLAKWVHWEGGTEPAEKAWPKGWIGRFTHWQESPPDFGAPVHPSLVVGERPTVYVFHEAGASPVRATYVPYYDPAYWYAGYRHVFSWRYQVVAVGKNVGDLLRVLLEMPMFYAVVLCWLVLGLRGQGIVWPVAACAALGVAIYLPVHLEGRYLAAFLAVLGVAALCGVAEASAGRRRVVLALVLLGLGGELALTQHAVWARARQGWGPESNVEWRAGEAVSASGLAAGDQVGVISWTANLHSDWAYLAGVQITSEIASGPDEAAFWALPASGQQAVLATFSRAGAKAVLTWDKPRGDAVGWRQVGAAPMWMYRF